MIGDGSSVTIMPGTRNHLHCLHHSVECALWDFVASQLWDVGHNAKIQHQGDFAGAARGRRELGLRGDIGSMDSTGTDLRLPVGPENLCRTVVRILAYALWPARCASSSAALCR